MAMPEKEPTRPPSLPDEYLKYSYIDNLKTGSFLSHARMHGQTGKESKSQ